jgi:ribosome biogenesis protein Tsr3
MIPTKIMPMHFSREFACDCTAATLAAIACASYRVAATICYPHFIQCTSRHTPTLFVASPINFVRTMQLATPSGLALLSHPITMDVTIVVLVAEHVTES